MKNHFSQRRSGTYHPSPQSGRWHMGSETATDELASEEYLTASLPGRDSHMKRSGMLVVVKV